MQVNLLLADPCPPQFVEIEPLRLSLKALREKFETILASEGFFVSDLSLATLCFTPDPGKDDYCTICHATLKSKDQELVEYIVNYLGQTLDAQSGKGRLLTGPPHTTRHAGPHRAVHHQGAHDIPHT